MSTRHALSLSWSPDGGRIAFSAVQRTRRQVVVDVAVMNADGSSVRPLTHTPKLWENNVDWSRVGGLIVFDRASGWWPGHVCVMRADGSGLRDLNPERRTLFQQPWQAPYKVFSKEPDWSPDGRRIAFSYLDPYYGLGDVWITGANEKGLVKLTHNWMDDGSPDWSPDGRRIVFVRAARYARKSEIVVMNVDGSGKRRSPTVSSRTAARPGGRSSPDQQGTRSPGCLHTRAFPRRSPRGGPRVQVSV